MDRHYIVKIESFEGSDTFVQCGDTEQDYLYCIVTVDDEGDAEIVDNGYRSFSEAANAWPHALNLKRNATPQH